MPPPRAPKPLQSRNLTGAPRRGVVLTDPAGRPYIAPFPEDGSGQALGADGTFIPVGSGSGDVVGPAGAVNLRIAVFDGVTGKLIKDGGKTIAVVLSDAATAAAAADAVVTAAYIAADAVVTAAFQAADATRVVGPASAVDLRIAVFDGTTGKLIKDGGKTIAVVLSDAATAAAAADAIVTAAYIAADVVVAAAAAAALAAHAALPNAHKGQKRSIVLDAGELMLESDLASPGADMVYGTNGSGVKGWKADPSGSGSGFICEPITDGDLTQPELIFALGDVIVACVPA